MHLAPIIRARLAAAALLPLLAACATPAAPPATTPPLAAWVQYVPDGLALRAVVAAGQPCPAVRSGNGSRPMQLRAAPGEAIAAAPVTTAAAAPDRSFPVAVCEADARGLTGAIDVGGRPLRLPRAAPQRIVIVGDSGCRLLGDRAQNCLDDAAWPWPRIAASAARLQPDLVIHVGDYHYRERCADPARCPALLAAGAGPGYGWHAWDADFFAPAAPLLRAAPWVFVRGNHENCNRAGDGWLRLLAPQPYAACVPDWRGGFAENHGVPAWRVELDAQLALAIDDSADVDDRHPGGERPADVERLRREFASLATGDKPAQRLWLLTHKPLWSPLQADAATPTVQQLAARGALPQQLDLVISGHWHFFSTLAFAGDADRANFPAGRPAQLIVGDSGAWLDAQIPGSPLYEGEGRGRREWRHPGERRFDGAPAERGVLLNRFGFLLLERVDAGWRGRLFDPDGREISACRLSAGSKRIDCDFPADDAG